MLRWHHGARPRKTTIALCVMLVTLLFWDSGCIRNRPVPDCSASTLPSFADLADVPIPSKTMYKDALEKARKEITAENAEQKLAEIERAVNKDLQALKQCG